MSEIFVSVQGEGIYVGERQVFVRMAGCSATCSWCDTPWSKRRTSVCRVCGRRGHSLENPVTVSRVVAEVVRLSREDGPIRTVSLTGGEPLEQSAFAGAVARVLKDRGFRIYLDTNGLEAAGIAKVVGHVDVFAVDIKLPSATGKSHWRTHRAFLRATKSAEVFVKIVVSPSTPLEELRRAVRLVAEFDPRTPLVLQPEGSALLGASEEARARMLVLLDRAQRYALERLGEVRVIPQCHKLLQSK